MIKRRGGELVQLHFKTQKTIWSDVKNLENRIHALPERNSFSDTQLVRSHSIQFMPLLVWWTLFDISFMTWFRRGNCKSGPKVSFVRNGSTTYPSIHSAEKIPRLSDCLGKFIRSKQAFHKFLKVETIYCLHVLL